MTKRGKKKSTNSKKEWRGVLLVSSIFLLALVLRFCRLEQTFLFSGELGHNLLAIKNAYVTKTIPLLGPPTSHPWLSFGPFFYWLFGPILFFSHFNPLSHAYFGASIGVLIIIANYFVITDILDRKVGLLSSFLMAVSPLFLEFSRAGRFFSIVTLLVYPFLWLFYKVINGEKAYLFPLFFVFGCMFSFHFTPLMLIPFMIMLIAIKKIKCNRKEVGLGIVGFLLAMLPFFIYDILHGLTMTKNVVLWIPYRVAGFVGLYPKNTISENVLHENVLSLSGFITKSFLSTNSIIWSTVFIVLLVFFIAQTILRYRKNPKDSSIFARLFFVLWFVWGYIAVFVHGAPPIHYFVPILSSPIILLSIVICDLWEKKYTRWGITLAVLLLTFVNFRYYFSPQWYYLPNDHMTQKPFYVPYPLQIAVAKAIISDAKGQKFILHRVGEDDQFVGDYAQNYQYLLWLYGNEPESDGSLVYTIYENRPPRLDQQHALLFQIDSLTVVKSTSVVVQVKSNVITRYIPRSQ